MLDAQVEQHKWAEEGAELKGRLTAHEAQLDLMQVSHHCYQSIPLLSHTCTQAQKPLCCELAALNGWQLQSVIVMSCDSSCVLSHCDSSFVVPNCYNSLV